MEAFDDGGLKDEGGTVDPVSGNDVPSGSTQEEVRDDIPAQLSEGEFVFPADVVRFIGLSRLMEMRQEAKQGLKKMESMGQMGNSDEATVSDDLPFNETDIVAEDDDGNVVEMAEGGSPSKYNQYMSTAGIKKVVYVNPETGDEMLVTIVSGTAIPAPPPGYVPKGSTTPDAIKESKITNPIQQPENIQEDREETYTVHNGKIINPGNPISLDEKSGANTWANLEGETMFDRAVDQSSAPSGWNTQNQREYNAMVNAGLTDVKAMWNGNDWDVYSPSLDNTAYGTPGRRGLQSKYGSLFNNVKTGFGKENKGIGALGVVSNIAQASNQAYIDGLYTAIGNKGLNEKDYLGDDFFNLPTNTTAGTGPKGFNTERDLTGFSGMKTTDSAAARKRALATKRQRGKYSTGRESLEAKGIAGSATKKTPTVASASKIMADDKDKEVTVTTPSGKKDKQTVKQDKIEFTKSDGSTGSVNLKSGDDDKGLTDEQKNFGI